MPFENISPKSNHIFEKTIALAEKGRGKVFPNPEVGCIIIKNKTIIGEGFHPFFGGPHAEVQAIFDAEKRGFSVEGAQVYVSLEPCVHHHKKTPPCAQLLHEKKVQSVHILFQDPNPKVAGKGAQYLEENGVPVFWAPLETRKKYQHFYDMFTHVITKTEPFITLKVAIDPNGCIGSASHRIMITGSECGRYTQQERDKYQAILSSRKTIETDNPKMRGAKTTPIKIMMTRTKEILHNPSLHFFHDEYHKIISPKHNESFLSKEEIYQFCSSKNIKTLWAEGGKSMSEFFIEQRIPTQVIIYKSPKIVEGKNLLFLDLKNLRTQYQVSQSFYLGNDSVEIWEKNISGKANI